MLRTRSTEVFAPGARVLIRDAEWLIRKVDRTSSGGEALTVVGISEIVRDKEAIFLTDLEDEVQVLKPEETRLVPDTSSAYLATRLYLESLLRQSPPTDEKLYIGHRAAMDLVDYQLDPALQSLQQPRQRILIADAVGLGKTLEAGVLLSELIRRGRGKRILVVAVKSMLTQFQKEMWSRFTIPLVRLDSVGLQRIRTKIPTNHNPFDYYDRAIISIDTLKNDAEYRTYLEKAWWDIIVIDEAHNVAERGGSSSLRSKLAKLLASRSDTLIMLSATPHDGRARSFASLMNMLNPTAIANPDDYGPDDIKGLFIRRFKKDIKDQVQTAFKERKIEVKPHPASNAEEAVFEYLAGLKFTRVDRQQGNEMLYKTTLEKALFSSPAAALSTIRTRLNRLKNSKDATFEEDIAALEHLQHLIEGVTPQHFSRFQALLHVIRDTLGWTPNDKRDRLVVFTERIETMKFLEQHLPHLLSLKPEQVKSLHGSLSDVDQNKIVDDFGREEAPVRLLIASDVASEGINLHFLCHRMVHFDIPWSLMVFQQRNGRIDRYGQEEVPHIVYLETESRNEKVRGDMRILELLIQKDDEAVKNIGDPSVFMGVYDAQLEEELTAKAIERQESVEAFDARLTQAAEFDALALLLGQVEAPRGEAITSTADLPSVFGSDFDYLRSALAFLKATHDIECTVQEDLQRIDLTAPEELRPRLRRLMPSEATPKDWEFALSPDPRVMKDEIRNCRAAENTEDAWPRIQYLWPLHPLMEWINDKVTVSFKRHEAPVLGLHAGLESEEVAFVLSGLIPNRKAHPLVHRWFAVLFKRGRFDRVEDVPSLLRRTGFATRTWPNRPLDAATIEAVRGLLPEAVKQARTWMSDQRRTFAERMDARLDEQLRGLERLRGRRVEQLKLDFGDSKIPARIAEDRREKKAREIDAIFDEYRTWIRETMTTEDNAFIQVVAVLRGGY